MLKLVADDGTYLGIASSDRYASDGVCNEYSNYGSKYGTDSIYNQYGNYGSEFANTSAYNKFTNTPPILSCESGETRNPVSKNTFLANAIDPDVLCDTLARNGY